MILYDPKSCNCIVVTKPRALEIAAHPWSDWRCSSSFHVLSNAPCIPGISSLQEPGSSVPWNPESSWLCVWRKSKLPWARWAADPAGISQPDHNCYCRDGSWAEWTEDSWCVFNAPKLQIFLHISEYYAIFVLTLWWYKKELQRSLYRLTPIHMFKMNKASFRFRVLLEGKTWDWAPSFYINQPPCSN